MQTLVGVPHEHPLQSEGGGGKWGVPCAPHRLREGRWVGAGLRGVWENTDLRADLGHPADKPQSLREPGVLPAR